MTHLRSAHKRPDDNDAASVADNRPVRDDADDPPDGPKIANQIDEAAKDAEGEQLRVNRRRLNK